ncbi:MAG TPA: diacylglycerol kinase family protein [bacterium]|nr:diacylglycerol kinase family protein [bacterium]
MIPKEESRHPKNMLLKVLASFRYAFSGLFHVLLTQRNMRFHFCMAVWVMCFAIVLDLTGFQKAYLFMVITFVFSMEVINTCIEALVDLLSPGYNASAKLAKDTAAAAVLVVSIGSLMSAGYLMLPPFFESFSSAAWLKSHMRDLLAVAVVVASVLVFWGTQVIRLPMIPLMLAGGGAASFSICLLCRVGNDLISFIAIQFFSILLFHSLGRKHDSVWPPIISHALGAVVYVFVASML